MSLTIMSAQHLSPLSPIRVTEIYGRRVAVGVDRVTGGSWGGVESACH